VVLMKLNGIAEEIPIPPQCVVQISPTRNTNSTIVLRELKGSRNSHLVKAPTLNLVISIGSRLTVSK